MKLVAYIRVSTDEQAESGHSLPLVQPQIIAATCEREGHELVDVIVDDGVSAGSPLWNRAGGKALREILESGEVDGVMVWKLDRLFRLGVDALSVGTWFLNRGLHIRSATEHIDINTPEGWMTFGIMALNAEYERRKIVARAVDVSRSLLANGRVYGPVPFGCVAVDGRLWRDPDTWRIRADIVAKKQCGYSYRAISDDLRERGIPAPNGGKRWAISTLRNVIETHHDLEHIPERECCNETGVSAA